MANLEQLAILHEGAEAWNRWRKENPDSRYRINLEKADLSNTDLSEANLSFAKLSGANLVGVNLSQSRLLGVDLSGVDIHASKLSGARLVGADLFGVKLTQVDLSYADMHAAQLIKAKLREVNISGATLGDSILVAIDLSAVKGLDSVRHIGPTSIDIDTLYLSKGNIPDVFLRGAGVPGAFIRYSKSLVGSATEYYSLFISYSTKDQDFADRLYADLQAKRVRCWFAPHDVQGGSKLHEQIDEAIRLHDKLLLILSPKQHGERVGEDGDLPGT